MTLLPVLPVLLAFFSSRLLFLSVSYNVGWRLICMGLQMCNRAIGRNCLLCLGGTHLYALPNEGLEILEKEWMKRRNKGKGMGKLTSFPKLGCWIYFTTRDRALNQRPLRILSAPYRLLPLSFWLWLFLTYCCYRRDNIFVFFLFAWTTGLPVGCLPTGLGSVTIKVRHRQVARGAEFSFKKLLKMAL